MDILSTRQQYRIERDLGGIKLYRLPRLRLKTGSYYRFLVKAGQPLVSAQYFAFVNNATIVDIVRNDAYFAL